MSPRLTRLLTLTMVLACAAAGCGARHRTETLRDEPALYATHSLATTVSYAPTPEGEELPTLADPTALQDTFEAELGARVEGVTFVPPCTPGALQIDVVIYHENVVQYRRAGAHYVQLRGEIRLHRDGVELATLDLRNQVQIGGFALNFGMSYDEAAHRAVHRWARRVAGHVQGQRERAPELAFVAEAEERELACGPIPAGWWDHAMGGARRYRFAERRGYSDVFLRLSPVHPRSWDADGGGVGLRLGLDFAIPLHEERSIRISATTGADGGIAYTGAGATDAFGWFALSAGFRAELGPPDFHLALHAEWLPGATFGGGISDVLTLGSWSAGFRLAWLGAGFGMRFTDTRPQQGPSIQLYELAVFELNFGGETAAPEPRRRVPGLEDE